MVHTGGGTHRSRPTNHMGSPLVFVGRHLRVPPCGMRDGAPPHCGECVPTARASPRPTQSERTNRSCGFQCVPAGRCGHRPLQGAYHLTAPYQRRDTQVPPYELCRQSVGECRAAPVCAAVRCGGDDDRRIPANPYPMYHPPAGLRGLWPSHRNNAKHGLRALPHKFGGTAPNH